jgi:hypothetical protein
MVCSKQNYISVVAWKLSRSIVALEVLLKKHWLLIQSTLRALALRSSTFNCITLTVTHAEPIVGGRGANEAIDDRIALANA